MTSVTALAIAARPNYKWWVVAMLWLISFFNYADRQAIFSVFPLLEREMNLTPVQLGLLGSAFAWVYGLGAPFAGMVVDRVRRKTAIIGGLHAWSLICMATVLSTEFPSSALLARGRRAGRDVLLPGVDVAHQRLPRPRDTIAGDGAAPDERLRGHDRRRILCGSDWSVLRLALVVHRLRRAWRAARVRAEPVSWSSRRAAPPTSRKPPAPHGATGHAALAGGQLSLPAFLRLVARTPTLLCLMGAFMCANFVAVVLLSWMPKFLYDKFNMGLAMAGLTATIFVQLASMAGAPIGGWLADTLRRRTPRGRMAVQMIGVLGGAPFVVLCGLTSSVGMLIVALTAWGFFKGLYDANIFASVFDVVRPEARGTAAGFMNAVGWLAGGGSAPIVIGIIAQRESLGLAIALASTVYVAAGLLLLTGILFFVKHDSARMQAELSAS